MDRKMCVFKRKLISVDMALFQKPHFATMVSRKALQNSPCQVPLLMNWNLRLQGAQAQQTGLADLLKRGSVIHLSIFQLPIEKSLEHVPEEKQGKRHSGRHGHNHTHQTSFEMLLSVQ